MDNTRMNCVLLADRHHELSEGVRGLLGTMFAGVFTVADEASLLEGAARIQPTLVVVDLSLAGGDIVELAEVPSGSARPQRRCCCSRVHDEPTVASAALAAGADGVVLKRAIATDLLPGSRGASCGQALYLGSAPILD